MYLDNLLKVFVRQKRNKHYYHFDVPNERFSYTDNRGPMFTTCDVLFINGLRQSYWFFLYDWLKRYTPHRAQLEYCIVKNNVFPKQMIRIYKSGDTYSISKHNIKFNQNGIDGYTAFFSRMGKCTFVFAFILVCICIMLLVYYFINLFD